MTTWTDIHIGLQNLDIMFDRMGYPAKFCAIGITDFVAYLDNGLAITFSVDEVYHDVIIKKIKDAEAEYEKNEIARKKHRADQEAELLYREELLRKHSTIY